MPQDINTRDALLVVLTLIASVTFQAGVNPPGGVWQEHQSPDLAPPPAATTINTNPLLIPPKDTHKPGKSILANDSIFYGFYIFCNTAAFSTSVYMIGSLLKVSVNGNGRQAGVSGNGNGVSENGNGSGRQAEVSGNGNGRQAEVSGNGNGRQAEVSGNGNGRQAEGSENGNGPQAEASEIFKAPGRFKLLVKVALSFMRVTYGASVAAVLPDHHRSLNTCLLGSALLLPILLLYVNDRWEMKNNQGNAR